VCCEWRVVAPGLKPLRLPRAPPFGRVFHYVLEIACWEKTKTLKSLDEGVPKRCCCCRKIHAHLCGGGTFGPCVALRKHCHTQNPEMSADDIIEAKRRTAEGCNHCQPNVVEVDLIIILLAAATALLRALVDLIARLVEVRLGHQD